MNFRRLIGTQGTEALSRVRQKSYQVSLFTKLCDRTINGKIVSSPDRRGRQYEDLVKSPDLQNPFKSRRTYASCLHCHKNESRLEFI